MVTQTKRNAQMLRFRQQYLYLAVTSCCFLPLFRFMYARGAELLRYNVAEDHFVTVGQDFSSTFGGAQKPESRKLNSEIPARVFR